MGDASADYPRVYTVKEVALILRCSQEAVRARVRSGKIQAIRLDGGPKGVIRIPKSEVDKLFAGGAT